MVKQNGRLKAGEKKPEVWGTQKGESMGKSTGLNNGLNKKRNQEN